MIRFLRDGKYSIKMEFDAVGADELFKAFESALNDCDTTVEIRPESSIEKNKVQKVLNVAKNNSDNKIYRTLDTLILELDVMNIEYGMEKFKDCIKGEDFYPAEFCEVFLKRNCVTIYGFLVK